MCCQAPGTTRFGALTIRCESLVVSPTFANTEPGPPPPAPERTDIHKCAPTRVGDVYSKTGRCTETSDGLIHASIVSPEPASRLIEDEAGMRTASSTPSRARAKPTSPLVN